MTDGTYRFHPTFSDGSLDLSSPHRPGFRVLDVGDPLRLAADQAYEEMRMRLDAKPRKRPDDDDDDDEGDDRRRRAAKETEGGRRQITARQAARDAIGKDARQMTLDELEAAAATAYEARSARMRNAWKDHRC
jgi:hypothetical protein